MSKSQSERQKMTAVQFMRSFDDTLAKIESISDKTAVEQKAMLESAQPYTNKEGLFEMAQLLDVAVSDEHEIPIWNSEKPQINEVDKGLIVEELADMLKHMHQDVIDFSDVGPIATVVQNKLGYKVNLEDYITDMITNAADWQDSQAFAHGKETPGVEEAEHAEFIEEDEGDRSPTDIEPKEDGVGAGPEVVVAEGDDLDDLANAVSSEFGFEEEGEIEGPDGEVAEIELGGEEGEEGEEGGEDYSFLNDEEDEEKIPESEEELDEMLESIKSSYLDRNSLMESLIDTASESLVQEQSVDAQLEAIRSNLMEWGAKPMKEDSDCSMNEDSDCEVTEDDEDDSEYLSECIGMIDSFLLTTQLESITSEFHQKEQAQFEAIQKEEAVTSMLESIASGYHQEKEAQYQAVVLEQQLNAQLESISSKFHSEQKAMQEAIQKEEELDTTLSSLIESYHSSAKTSNSKARLEAREKIQSLSK